MSLTFILIIISLSFFNDKMILKPSYDGLCFVTFQAGGPRFKKSFSENFFFNYNSFCLRMIVLLNITDLSEIQIYFFQNGMENNVNAL